MGTVGLSFGSPTSGTGFNVSTTVAEIVSNLQNVETPWKTQLTALAEPGHGDLKPGNAVFESLQRHELPDRSSGHHGAEGGFQLRPERAHADGGQHTAVAGTHTVTGDQLWPRPRAGTWRRSPTPPIHADGFDHATGGQRRAADDHAELFQQHAGGAGLGDQLLRGGHDRQRADRFIGVAAEPGLGHLGSERKYHRQARTRSAIPRRAELHRHGGQRFDSLDRNSGRRITNPGDTLSGSITIQMGNGTTENVVIGASRSNVAANTVYTGPAATTRSPG